MTATFSYTFDLSPEIKLARFKIENDEEFVLTHELTWNIYGNSLLSLIVESCSTSDVLIVAEVSSNSINSIKRSSRLENKRAVLSFQNINFMTHDPWRCIIHVIPHVELRDLHTLPASSSILASLDRKHEKIANLEQLSADFQQIFNVGDLSDVILTDGTVQIPAHKVILSARSPVFARMFKHAMKENNENLVSISDISQDVLKELVTFIYTGVVTIMDLNMARNLYIAADKYAIKDLKSMCSGFLKSLSIDDVLDTFSLADLYDDKDLKRVSLDFISKNYSKVKSSTNWEKFMEENQGLAIEILSFIIDNKI